MDFLSNKVLITGCNGFTGKYLKKYLEGNKYEVFGISNQIDKDDSAIFQCDITNIEEIKAIFKKVQPNYIIHLAAISFVQHADIQEIYNVNVIGTQNLLDACVEIKKSINKIVLASSATVYGNQSQSILDEKLCPNPNNHYGISKLAMEFLAKTYFDKLPILITRPFNYTAPGHGEMFVIPKIAKAFTTKASELELGNLEVYREYNSIHYVCEVYYKLMISEAHSEIVNIASGKTHSLVEIISLFENQSNHSVSIKINPLFIRKNETFRLAGDIKKLSTLIDLPKNNSIKDVITSFLL